ncbi:unnamed protein product, partial [Allacma fusca]
ENLTCQIIVNYVFIRPETQIFLNNHIRCVERIKMKKEFLETTNPRGPTSSNINIISSSTTLKTSKGSYIT